MPIENILAKWTACSDANQLDLSNIYSTLFIGDIGIDTVLKEYGLDKTQLLNCDESVKGLIEKHLLEIDRSLLCITEEIRVFVIKALFLQSETSEQEFSELLTKVGEGVPGALEDHGEITEQRHLELFRECRENIYDHYRNIRSVFHEIKGLAVTPVGQN